ncbi:hypothetical protein [Paenarthrobacter nitroguajacolicus]|uniref:PGAP1-like alpha/beta domain-containing protein n=1 Tax=Paenarthrobacter nitroguajacolicus TaxID=211146 RepID=UPI00248CE5EE|nr:hypothetical protein [Paenarthrobacter nitroguajacolicus]MDI2034854.1 hypothetical protein [Paenarthrobacter nitroguajacolicus]
MSLHGMDVEAGRRLSKEFARSSQRLLDLSGSLTPLITNVQWHGDDGQRFAQDWKAYRSQLVAAGHALEAASNAVQRNVEEQLAASTTSAGSGGSTALDRLLDSASEEAGDLWDDVGRVTSVLAGTASTMWHLAQDLAPLPVGNLMDAEENRATRFGDFVNMGWGWLISGEPPSITQLVSNGVLFVAATWNTAATVTSFGFHNPHLMDDGRPVAGEPIPLTVGNPNKSDANGRSETPVPSSISAIVATTNAAYGDAGMAGTEDTGIRITTVDKPGGPPAYIVSIPGTTRWMPDGAANPTDLTGNLELAGGNLSTAAEAVRLAMEKAGIPNDAPVMLSGHSQGGMIATALASDSSFTNRFNVTNVVTFGSPVDSAPIPASIDVLALQHAGDPVPQVDLADATLLPGGGVSATRDNNAMVVTLPNPDIDPGFAGISYHDSNRYVESVTQQEGGGPINQYSQKESTQQFLTIDASQVSSTVSNISRKQ